ncbi:glycosyltransferase family 1 protein [Gelidibacter gilvus]|uniref:Glycosyltransferase family 1 protein n=1 Tax=Gelidibacter gilvus TaxID=59602 RepID=A0A4Q0XDE0_9FLAO|nr:glycosyltransferase family 1 protein [Gelidibacter gilvus]RXJ45962.1 glycosyltransferase family 1 protein [Gelidibacter gilvus]
MNKEKPIRVLHVLTIMNLGGAETMIMNYYRHIDKNKVQFDFLLHREDKGFFDDEIEYLGGKIYRMPAISPKNYFLYKKKLNIFFSEHPEYKIVHSHLNALSSIILSVAKSKNIPYRIAHSHLAVESMVLKNIFKKNTDIKATLKDFVQSLIRGKVKKVATHFFACGEKAGDWLFGQKNKTKVTIINNAIHASSFSYNTIKADKMKEEFGIKNKKVIGHVGRFNEQKNHFLLIKIFNEIYKKNNNCVLLLIGNGNLKDKVKEEAKRLNIYKNILFLGLRDDIPELLQGFDLFLFPSLYEGLPVTLIEAQASGLKIITSSTVTKEVDITGLITFIDLEKPEFHWAESVLNNINYNRKNTFNQIKEGGYDIFENAKKLQIFYLNII